MSTAALAYILGLRHALDADHISVRASWKTQYSYADITGYRFDD